MGGSPTEEQHIRLQMVSVPVLNPPEVVGPQDSLRQRTYLAAYSACAHPSSVICYGSYTVDVIQEHTLAL